MLSKLSAPPPKLPQAIHPNSNRYNLAQAPASAHSSTAFFDPADALTTTESSTVTSVDFPAQPPPVVFPDFAARQSGSGGNRVVYGSEPQIDSGTRDRKRMKTSSSSSSSRGGSGGGVIVQSSPTIGSLLAPASGTEVSSTLPVVMVDTQEVGIRLVHALMACAEAVHQENFKVAMCSTGRSRFSPLLRAVPCVRSPDTSQKPSPAKFIASTHNRTAHPLPLRLIQLLRILLLLSLILFLVISIPCIRSSAAVFAGGKNG
ncbi:hypothetical protein M5K25_013288 [Dendrobium thyrsiflorum]|uniref:DELLA protein n=1 Tax=Dendrobium thyrsiflorum TaxID=117978 RepID=A0ABD0USL8_DENTH